jgi:hypothetical protein
MSLSAMDPASFGQSFSPYTTNQSLPLQQQPFPLQGQPTPSFGQNGSQQQQYQHMPGSKSFLDDNVVAHVLTCLATLSLRAAVFTGHVTFGRNAHDSLSFASCPIRFFCSCTEFASAITHGCPTVPTTPVSIRRRITSEHFAREGENITATRDQPRIAAGNAQVAGAGQGRRNQPPGSRSP